MKCLMYSFNKCHLQTYIVNILVVVFPHCMDTVLHCNCMNVVHIDTIFTLKSYAHSVQKWSKEDLERRISKYRSSK